MGFPDPAPLIAPLFVANSLNWLGLGFIAVQCYYYFQNFPADPIKIRILVYVLFGLELVQTATTTHQTWWYMVTNWNNPPALLAFPWSAMTVPTMAGIIAAVVQIFYAWRIWTLSRAKFIRATAILIVILALTQSITAIVTAAVFASHSSPTLLAQLHPEFTLWIASSFAADVLVAGCMLWILYTARSQTIWSKTDNVIRKLVVVTIGTGASIALCGALTMALFATTVGASFQYLPAAYIWGKLYSNSVMVTLNCRRSRTSPATTFDKDTIPMQIHVPTQRDIHRQEHLRGAWPVVYTPISSIEHESDSSGTNQETPEDDAGAKDPPFTVQSLNGDHDVDMFSPPKGPLVSQNEGQDQV